MLRGMEELSDRKKEKSTAERRGGKGEYLPDSENLDKINGTFGLRADCPKDKKTGPRNGKKGLEVQPSAATALVWSRNERKKARYEGSQKRERKKEANGNSSEENQPCSGGRGGLTRMG